MTFPQSIKEAVKERGTAREGCEDALAVTTQCHMHNFKARQPTSQSCQPEGLPTMLRGQGGVMCHQREYVFMCIEDNKFYLLLNVRVRFRALVVGGAEARGL